MEQGGGVYIPACNGARGGVYPACNGARGCVSQHAMGQGEVCIPECNEAEGSCVTRGCDWGCVWGGGVHPPTMVSKRAVCILLECFLVYRVLCFFSNNTIVGIALSAPSGLKSEHCMHPGKVSTQHTLYIACLGRHPYLLSLLYQLLHKHRVIYWILS